MGSTQFELSAMVRLVLDFQERISYTPLTSVTPQVFYAANWMHTVDTFIKSFSNSDKLVAKKLVSDLQAIKSYIFPNLDVIDKELVKLANNIRNQPNFNPLGLIPLIPARLHIEFCPLVSYAV